jgi:D-methionine transport system substrate-binding protein
MNRRMLLATIGAFALAGCGAKTGANGDPNTLTVAATAVPHAEILDFVKPALEKQGMHLEVRVFNDYVQPNTQVAEGRIAVNYFQTEPYLAEFNKAHHTRLVTIAGVHVEPFGAYSRKWKTLAELPDGATVAIPNEPSNSGRALQLLAKAGLLTLLDPKSISATPKDIVTNPKNLKFRELEAATLPRVLGEVDLALINTNYALDAGLNPTRDALAIEGKDSPYVNFIVGPESARSDPRVQKLVAALRTPEVKAFIERKYKGAVVPAF